MMLSEQPQSLLSKDRLPGFMHEVEKVQLSKDFRTEDISDWRTGEGGIMQLQIPSILLLLPQKLCPL